MKKEKDNKQNPVEKMEAVAMYSLLGKDRDMVIDLMNKYGEDITLSDLFNQICEDRNKNLKIILLLNSVFPVFVCDFCYL